MENSNEHWQKQDRNPFGYKDHRPFSGFSDELVYGIKPDGRIAHVSDVLSGLLCDCRCPACDLALVAKKGPKQLHHFAHHIKSVSCSHIAETNAHIWAKEFLEREKRLTIPPIIAEHEGQKEIVSPARIYTFAHAKLEKRLNTIVPDVVLITENGTQLIVEVRVTHACDETKVAKLRSIGLSAVEIDLRRFRTSTKQAEVEDALLTSGPRDWLSNAKQAKFDDRLRDRLAAEAAKKLRELEDRAKRLAAAEARRVRSEQMEAQRESARLIQAVRTHKGDLNQIPDRISAFVEQFHDVPWSHPKTVGFAVHPLIWQADLVKELITFPNALDYQWPEKISISRALRTISRHLVPDFRRPLAAAVIAKLRDEWPHHRVPTEAVELFLDDLAGTGFLWRSEAGEFTVTQEYADRLSASERRRQEFESRSEDLRHRINVILARLPASELGSFDLDRWLTMRAPGQKADPTTLCRLGDDAFRDFDRALKRIELLSEGGPVTDEILGLPLSEEIARAQLRAREKLLMAASNRRLSLTQAAQLELGEDANSWLSGPSEDDDEMSWIDQAGLDDLSYQRARVSLASAAVVRRAAIRARNEASSRRNELRQAASKVYDEQHLELFLHTFHPKFGKSPFEHCVNHRTMQECIELLPRTKRTKIR